MYWLYVCVIVNEKKKRNFPLGYWRGRSISLFQYQQNRISNISWEVCKFVCLQIDIPSTHPKQFWSVHSLVSFYWPQHQQEARVYCIWNTSDHRQMKYQRQKRGAIPRTRCWDESTLNEQFRHPIWNPIFQINSLKRQAKTKVQKYWEWMFIRLCVSVWFRGTHFESIWIVWNESEAIEKLRKLSKILTPVKQVSNDS